MRADNTAIVVQAARDRREATLRRANEALQRLDRAGAIISFVAVAEAGSVSRAWLYREPTLRAEIQRLRSSRTSHRAPVRLPSAQRASNESLQRRLEAATEEISRLKQENRQLREQIAKLHGERRTDMHLRPPRTSP
ncbi:MAG: DUF6262 family protein [Acidimicrobiales bacterium]